MAGTVRRGEAERLIEEANHVGHSDPQRADGILRAAQTHALLAVADVLDELVQTLKDRPAPERGLRFFVDTREEGCVDHIPVASGSCRECARAQGVAL